MITDTRTDAERRYDAERDGSLYTQPATNEYADLPEDIKEWIDGHRSREHSPLFNDLLGWVDAQIAADDDELAVADWIDTQPAAEAAPPRRAPHITVEEADTWTDFRSGGVLITVYDGGVDLTLYRNSIDGVPITFDMLGALMVDLSKLLADDRLRAALGERPLLESVEALLAERAA